MFDTVSDKGVSSKVRQGKFGKLGLWMEHGLFFGNIFGIMRNSHSRKMQMASNIMFNDPRMEESFVDFLPSESIKQLLMDRWNSQYNAFVDKRQKYINDTYGMFNIVHRNNLIHKVNEQVIDCYNARARGDAIKTKEFPKEIQEMASDLETITDDIMKQMQKKSENLGGRKGLGSLLNQEDTVGATKEFYRITDETKMMNWLSHNYDNLDDALEDLTEYARRFMDRDAETKYFIELKKREFDNKPKKTKNDERIQWTEPTQEEIEKHLEEAAKGWAKGRIDKNMSRLNFDPKESHLQNPYTAFTDTLKHRLPVDTTGVMKLKNGVEFSFDKNMRSYDLDGFLPQIMNRISGEVALRATIGDSKTQKEFFDSIAQELGKNMGVINGERELEALQMGIHKLLGIGSYNCSEQRIWDGLSNMLRSWSYANVGGNMTWAQLGELGGALAYGGFKVLMNNLPVFKNLGKNMRLGSTGAKIVENVNRKMYAEEIGVRGWRRSDSTESKVFSQLFDKVSEENPVASRTGRTLDAVNRNIKRAALMTSTVNFMPKLTNAMVRSMREAAIEDCLQWASGKNMKSLVRNPFSAKKCAAAGLHRAEDITKVQNAIKKYLIDGKGNVDAWLDEDPMTFAKFKRLVDNESLRGIQQNSIGNMTPFKEKHRIFFQFKDFTLKAMNQQFMRALSSRERDDVMAALYSYATNTATYYGMTVAKAYMYYPNDEKKRQEYLEKNANPMKVALAGFFRMSMTAPMSFVSDGWEMATGQSMYRTTVDNTRNTRDTSDSWDKRVTDAANQAPALGTIGKLYNATQSTQKLATGEGTTKDIDKVIQALPLGQYLLMGRVAAGLKESSKLPESKQQSTKKKQKTPLANKQDLSKMLKSNSKSQKKQEKKDIVSKFK
nr:internal virion protein with endolysin domain [Autographiviridae sp.]